MAGLIASAVLIAGLSSSAPATDQAVLHYVRSNSDGSEREDVVVYRQSAAQIAVMKAKSRCTNAAYVTARLNPSTGQAEALVGGRLQRDGTQQPFAWLDHDKPTGRLVARLGAPDAPPLFEVQVGGRWVLYDFDFSDLIAHPPAEIGQRKDFAFELPLLLTGEDSPTFENRGELRLAFAREERRNGKAAFRYRATGAPLAAGQGDFWFDARSGVLVEARLPLANHSEYRDFRLRLVKAEHGEAAWNRRLARHWKGCAPQP